MARPICLIAEEIERIWRTTSATKQSYYRQDSRPYLDAMKVLTHINQTYGLEQGKDIVNRFLVNVAGWRGEDARRIKAELKEMLK